MILEGERIRHFGGEATVNTPSCCDCAEDDARARGEATVNMLSCYSCGEDYTRDG